MNEENGDVGAVLFRRVEGCLDTWRRSVLNEGRTETSIRAGRLSQGTVRRRS